jgi:hypothetical protein
MNTARVRSMSFKVSAYEQERIYFAARAKGKRPSEYLRDIVLPNVQIPLSHMMKVIRK